MRVWNRAPAAWLTMLIAGIGLKAAIRSGPQARIVCTYAAAASSTASSQLARTKPPVPRADLYRRASAGFPVISAQAATGSPSWPALASRNMSSSTPRT
jgi:hypothetical protein